MAEKRKRQRFAEQHLDPASRMGEVLFGLIMVLSVTLTVGLSAPDGEGGIHELLYAALGCNVAWGIIDGVMYVMNCLVERGVRSRLVVAIREASDRGAALEVIRDAVEPQLEPLAAPAEREALYEAIYRRLAGGDATRPAIEREDLYGALASFWLVFISCFPAVIPFLLIPDPRVALYVSNVLLLGMLFVVGAMWGGYARTSRVGWGAAMLSIGLVLVGVAVALGG